jgi:hypothetical protein
MPTTEAGQPLEPFTINIDQSVLDDLVARLKATRFAPDLDNEDERYGLGATYLRRLVEYWANEFDWRTNRFARLDLETLEDVERPVCNLRRRVSDRPHLDQPHDVLGQPSHRNLDRAYKKPNLYPWTPSHDRQPPVQAPAGFTLLIGDRSPFDGGYTPEERLAAFKTGGGRFYGNVCAVNVHRKGGHFGPWENPEAWIHDRRSTYRSLR